MRAEAAAGAEAPRGERTPGSPRRWWRRGRRRSRRRRQRRRGRRQPEPAADELAGPRSRAEPFPEAVILDGGGFGRSIVRGAGLAIGVTIVAAVVLVGLAALNVLVLVFIAVILASGLQPFIAWIRGHLPIGRGPTILIVYGFFLATVVGLAFVVIPAAYIQLERTMDSLPPFFERARTWAQTLHPATLSK